LADQLVYSTGRVFAYVSERVPLSAVAGMVGMGLERDGDLVAGIIYEGFNGPNIWMHVAGSADKRWLTRSFLRAGFAYPFVQCGVARVSGYVEARNTAARRFDEHLGFTEEARLQGAAADGGDVIIYVMRKENCRYVDSK
jgi:RimJ/RimL family protein N-acetyltransferase